MAGANPGGHPYPHPGPPPPPPPHYHYHDDGSGILIGCGVGLLLGAIASNIDSGDSKYSQQEQDRQERAQKTKEIRQTAKDNVQKETDHALELVAQNGVDNTIAIISRSWEDQGQHTFVDDRGGTAVLRVTGFKSESNIKLEYTFQRENKKVIVRTTVPDYDVTEESSGYYTEPKPVSSIMQFIGFELAEGKRDAGGHLIIQDVAKGTAASFAGIAPGDSLIKIDSYDTKSFGVDRINAYTASRAGMKTLVNVTFKHKGTVKTVDIQL